MLLELHRYESSVTGTATIGRLYVDGVYECFTLEDRIRPSGVKVQGQTAIAAGVYRVIIDFSNRFQRPMPHILDVPDFTGIRIHPLNTSFNTEGCIGVGQTHPSRQDFIGSSVAAFHQLMYKLEDALGLVRQPAPGNPFRYEDEPWLYQQDNTAEDVRIRITNDLLVAIDPALTAE